MTTRNYASVTDLAELKALVAKLADDGLPIGFDIETSYDGPDRAGGALDPLTGFICGFSITNDKSWARYIPLQHDFATQLDPDDVWPVMKPLLETGKVVAHNAKFEKRFLRAVEIDLHVHADTGVEAFILSEFGTDNGTIIGLKDLVRETFGHHQKEITTLFPNLSGKALKAMKFSTLDVTPEVIAYACEDAAWCLALHERNGPRVAQAFEFIRRVDHDILDILCDVEDVGVRVDWEMLTKWQMQAERFKARMTQEIIADLSALSGKTLPPTFNLGSPAQLKAVLFDDLGMRTSRTTKTGAPSTDKIAMEKLSKQYPVVRKILDLREVGVFWKRYCTKWLDEYRHYPDGRTHPSYNATRIGSARFAVNDPPIQQCPKKFAWELADGTKFGGNFREAIIPDPGWYILDFDYSQVELRVMAGESQEPALIEAFNTGKDVHTITASMMLGVPQAQITKDQRAIGKTMNFALLYGMGVKSLADRLAVTQERAQELYDAYFSGFPSITSWMDKMKREGKRCGYTMTRFGRKSTVWDLKSDNPKVFSKGERICVNTPIQGGAADYMRIAMVRVRRALQRRGWWLSHVRLIMNNHDALTFEVIGSLDPREVVEVIRSAVEFPVEGLPKIEAEFAMGTSWGNMVELDDGDHPVIYEFVDDMWTVRYSTDEDVEREDDEVLEDEETGELILPKIDVDLSAIALPKKEAAPTQQPTLMSPVADVVEEYGEPRTLVVEIPVMPTNEQFSTFITLLRSNSGSNTVLLKTPEGEVTLDQKTSLSVESASRISMVLGGARVFHPAEEIDSEVLVGGLVL